MAVLPTNLARVSNSLRSNTALFQLRRTQEQLLRTQNELATGRRINAPSDDPGAAAVALQLRKTLERSDAYSDNLRRAAANLSEVDSTLGDVTQLIQQASNVAQTNVGDSVTQAQRENAATVVKSIYSQLILLGNKSFQGSYLFAGDKLDKPPFEEFAGGVKFVGSEITLSNDVDEASANDFQVNGADVFGALSTRIEGSTTLTPALSTATRLKDIAGTSGQGVKPGLIRIGNGATATNVDLTDADSIADVVSRINAAGVGTITAGINATGNGITLSGAPGDAISVTDIGGTTTAADLGIVTTGPAAAGVAVVGSAINPRITGLTNIADLNNGAGIDLNGFTITNGSKSTTINVAGATTVEDVLNAVNGADVGVRLQIKADGSGLRLINPTQGNSLNVSENGGSTASDLGLRSFGPDSTLAELNAGQGVRTVTGADFKITDANGVAFDVDLTAATLDVQDTIDAINAASTTAASNVIASFSPTTNGIVLSSAGPGTLKIESQNFSQAAADLGLTTPAVGNVITGTDVNPVVAQGTFANVAKLRDALLSGDQKAITQAAEAIQNDFERAVRVRGDVGTRVQEIEQRQDRLADQNLSTKALLSELEDTDFNEAISRFSLLQTSLEANLKTTSTLLNLSLIDYLR
jgi:flagellar hook-associated protein 3 FlgL